MKYKVADFWYKLYIICADAAKTPLSEHMPKSSRKLDEGAFAEKCEHLRLLAQKDPKLAIEQFSKLINDKEQQISVTGTMKDFKVCFLYKSSFFK